MNYIIQLQCVNEDNSYNFKYGQYAYVSDVFGLDSKYTTLKDNAYKFISSKRVNMICDKVDKKMFKPSIIKTI